MNSEQLINKYLSNGSSVENMDEEMFENYLKSMQSIERGSGDQT